MEFNNKITILVCEEVYLKNPESSDLGKKIVSGAIDLIYEIGFEKFTFRKLALKIESTEASIYRYFTSKHNLLVYLVLWYWGWQEYRLILKLTNVEDPKERLERAIGVLTEKIEQDSNFSQIDEVKLNEIVISESAKAYFNKAVDHDNELGYFKQYEHVVSLVGKIILEINPTYKYPNMLVSTIIDGALHQRYFADHIPSLTDQIDGHDAVKEFYESLVIKEIAS